MKVNRRRRIWTLSSAVWILLVLAAAPLAAQTPNYSDVWWDPSNPGWALMLADHGAQLSGLLLGYGSGLGAGVWFVIPAGNFTNNKSFFATDVYYAGGSQPLIPSPAGLFRIGKMSLDFMPPGLPSGTALFTFSLTNGPTYTEQIQRYPFGDAPANWGSDYTDLWWSPAQPDGGVALVQHGDSVFGAWFTYSALGSPYWYYFSANPNGASVFSSQLDFQYGPYLPASPFDSSGAVSWNMGGATFNFSSNPAMFSPTIAVTGYSADWTQLMDGSTPQWPIVPLQFGQGRLATFCVSPQIAPAPTIFTASPISLSALEWITPLGNLNPPEGHTSPTDHIYFYFADPDEDESPLALQTQVFAPGNGTITSISTDTSSDGTDSETDITVQVSPTITYYLSGFIANVPLATGTQLTAGQPLGTTGSGPGLDLGVINLDVTQTLVNPSRYTDQTLHADGPIKYYTGSLQSQLYLKTHRIQPECDGKINYDVAGTLSGNWYYSDWANASFAMDTYDPTQVRINVPYGMKPEVEGGVMSINPGQPLPINVTPASGMVLYTLMSARTGLPAPGAPMGYLLVQMLDDTHVEIEPFGPADTPPTNFTSQAIVFTR